MVSLTTAINYDWNNDRMTSFRLIYTVTTNDVSDYKNKRVSQMKTLNIYMYININF